MKILKEEVWWKFTCRVCKSVCQAEPSDVRAESVPDYHGDHVGCYDYYVECGKCGAERKVPENKLTKKICAIGRKRQRR